MGFLNPRAHIEQLLCKLQSNKPTGYLLVQKINTVMQDLQCFQVRKSGIHMSIKVVTYRRWILSSSSCVDLHLDKLGL